MEGSSLAINITKFQSLRVLADSATELRMSLPINIFISNPFHSGSCRSFLAMFFCVFNTRYLVSYFYAASHLARAAI